MSACGRLAAPPRARVHWSPPALSSCHRRLWRRSTERIVARSGRRRLATRSNTERDPHGRAPGVRQVRVLSCGTRGARYAHAHTPGSTWRVHMASSELPVVVWSHGRPRASQVLTEIACMCGVQPQSGANQQIRASRIHCIGRPKVRGVRDQPEVTSDSLKVPQGHQTANTRLGFGVNWQALRMAVSAP